MSISRINDLERRGEVAAALDLSFELMRERAASDPCLAELYRKNTYRMYQKLDGPAKWGFIGRSMVEPLSSPNNFLPDPIRSVDAACDTSAMMISLVVPCYNAEKYLPATLESISAQTSGNFECILVDDFSTDGTAEIARNASRRDKRFRFYQHRANGGLAAARNSGIRLARGEFVAFLDADDLLASNSLAKRAAMLGRCQSLKIVAGVYDFSQTISDDFSGVIESAPVSGRPDYVDFISGKGDCPFSANQPMLKRHILVEMGGFPEEYPQAEDWRLWSKVLRAGYAFVAVPTIGSGYRQTAGSMIRRNPLLHVERSRGNFLRAHSDYGDETNPVELAYEDLYVAHPLFEGEWGGYFAQQQLIARVLTFVGIELGRRVEHGPEVSIDELNDFVQRMVPDFHASVAGFTAKDLYEWLGYGYKRYYGVTKLDKQSLARFRPLAYRVIGRLFADVVWRELGADRLLLPARQLRAKAPKIVDVVFLPHKKYHTYSFELLIPVLRAAGLSFVFVDSTVPYRDENAYDERLKEHFVSYNEFVFSRILPRVVVCMNDWDTTVVKPVVKSANACGIPTVGIVEGVQDFHDMDTGRTRNPYREVGNVFLPGEFDRKYFQNSDQTLWVTGVQRLDGLAGHAQARASTARGPNRRVVVNVNFSYGVMTDRRDQWVIDIQTACSDLGYEMVVSQHPQDDGDLSQYKCSQQPLYELLAGCDVFVSRFSGAILESLVIGCPVVYYNGHGELVDKFHDSLGDYGIANDPAELRKALAAAIDDVPVSGSFLKAHCDIDPNDGRTSIDKTVYALSKVVQFHPLDLAACHRFKTMLGGGSGLGLSGADPDIT